MANLGDISKINLPNGNVVNIKDTTARAQANWNTNNGVKNLLDVTYDTYTNNECSYVKNADGSVTLTISSTVAANRQLNLTDKMDNIYDGMIINGSPTGYSTGNIEYLITGLKADGSYQNEQFSYNGAESTINRGTSKIQFAIYVKSGVTARTVTFYPMVREVGDSTYQPYALPNTKITPELIELVDSGAKNIFSPTITTGVDSDTNLTLTVNSDNTITISGTAQSSKYIVIGRGYTTAGNYVLSGTPSGITVDTGGYMRIEQGGDGVSQVLTPVDITLDNREYVVYLRVLSGKTYNHTISPMLCTKAAWDVSQKYVPYAPTNAELYEMIKALQS